MQWEGSIDSGFENEAAFLGFSTMKNQEAPRSSAEQPRNTVKTR
jgi:hypothetical protein